MSENWDDTLWQEQLRGPAAKLLPFLEDPEVTDLLLQGVESAFVERAGRLEPVSPPFASHEEFSAVIERLLTPLAKGIDAARPYIDGRLANGARFHLILPPIAIGGPFLSIRKFSRTLLPLSAFADANEAGLLRAAVVAGETWLISGATGAGKTSLLAALLAEIPSVERVVILEETREIPLRAPHLVFLECRTANADGKGAVTLRDLVRNCLRMRPDRIVVGECRGEEAFDLIQALATGHPGLATIHAAHPRGALARLEALTLLSRPTLTLEGIRRWIAGTIRGVVQLGRVGGVRRVREIVQISGIERENYIFTPLYAREGEARIGS